MSEPLNYARSAALPSRPLSSGAILALLGLALIVMAGGFFVLIQRQWEPPSFDNITAFDTQALVNAKLQARAAIRWTWHQTLHVIILYACAIGCLGASAAVLIRSVRKLMMA